MRTIDFLPNHEDIKIIQDDEMFRINTDTACLGEFVEVYKEDVVLDIGTNNGALLMYASFFKPKKLIGIDINKEGIEDAKNFAEVNSINNAKFYSGNILKLLDKFKEEGFNPDVVVVDPPRKGMELQLINYLQKSKIKKIVYVSCNPATLVKNINHLQKKYAIKHIQPIDVFSQTSNIECIVELCLK